MRVSCSLIGHRPYPAVRRVAWATARATHLERRPGRRPVRRHAGGRRRASRPRRRVRRWRPPVELSSTYVGAGTVPTGQPMYGRVDNATWRRLRGGDRGARGRRTGTRCSPPGMAAISAVPRPGAARRRCSSCRRRLQHHARLADAAGRGAAGCGCGGSTSPTPPPCWPRCPAPTRAALLWLESPTNPMLEVADLRALRWPPARDAGALGVGRQHLRHAAGAAPARPRRRRRRALGHQVPRPATPTSCSARGHADDPAVCTRGCARTGALHGAIAGPLEAWLALRGLRTLALRVERAQTNAAELARRLATTPPSSGSVTRACPSTRATRSRRSRCAASARSSRSRCAAAPDGGRRVVAAVRLWVPATSLGGVESMLERRRRYGTEPATVPEDLLRLSVGIEDVEDLWRDLDARARPAALTRCASRLSPALRSARACGRASSSAAPSRRRGRPSCTTATTACVIGMSTPCRCASSQDRPARLHALGGLPGQRRSTSSTLIPWPRLRAEGAVARQRRRAGGHEVAHARQPGERRRVGAESRAEPGGLGQAAGDDRRLGVVAHAQALGHADGERDDVLHRAAELDADDVVVGVGPEVRRSSSRAATQLGAVVVDARDDRGGRLPERRSPCARFGPETTAIRSAGTPADLGDDLAHPQVVPSSTPFISDTSSGVVAEAAAPTRSRFARSVCDGTASTTMSAPSSTSAGSVDASMPAGQLDVGQVVLVAVPRRGSGRRPPRGGPTSAPSHRRRPAPWRTRCPSCRCPNTASAGCRCSCGRLIECGPLRKFAGGRAARACAGRSGSRAASASRSAREHR